MQVVGHVIMELKLLYLVKIDNYKGLSLLQIKIAEILPLKNTQVSILKSKKINISLLFYHLMLKIAFFP